MKIKSVSKNIGGSWQAPIDIGAKAENVEYEKDIDGSSIKTDLKTELDSLNANKLNTTGGNAGDLNAGLVTADASATIALISDIISATSLDEVWGKFNRLKALASAHELTQLNSATGIHGFRYYNDELSYYNGTDWVVISAAGGHTIKNSSGTDLAQRDNLQFVNFVVSDDENNNKTVVKNPIYNFNTIAEMNYAIQNGLIENHAVIYVKENSGGGGGGGGGGSTSVKFIFLSALPPVGEEGAFYFIENGQTGDNKYNEYIWNVAASEFEKIAEDIVIDASPVQNSNNPVSSGGVYTALRGKQDTLTFDNAPTVNSNNPVKSRGIYSSIQNILSQIADTYSTSSVYNIGDVVLYAGVLYKCKTVIAEPERWTASHWDQKTIEQLIDENQIDTDSVPTQNSTNVVQSGGTYNALANKVSVTPNQGLTDDQKANARNNIGAGTSNFSGSYVDLTNTPTFGSAATKDTEAVISDSSLSNKIPTSAAVASFVESKGYLTSAPVTSVNGQTGAVVIDGGISFNFNYTSVDDLPTVGTAGTFYMIPIIGGGSNNDFDEYVWVTITQKYEKIGSTKVDLTDYATKSYVDNKFASMAIPINPSTTPTANGSIWVSD